MTITKNTHLPPGSIPKGARTQPRTTQSPAGSQQDSQHDSTFIPAISQTSKNSMRSQHTFSDQIVVNDGFQNDSLDRTEVSQSQLVAMYDNAQYMTPTFKETTPSFKETTSIEKSGTRTNTSAYSEQIGDIPDHALNGRSFVTPPGGLSFQFITDLAKQKSEMEIDDFSRANDNRKAQIHAIINDFEAKMENNATAREKNISGVGVDDDGEETVQEDRILGLFFAAGNLGVAFYDEPNVMPSYPMIPSYDFLTEKTHHFVPGRTLDGANGRYK